MADDDSDDFHDIEFNSNNFDFGSSTLIPLTQPSDNVRTNSLERENMIAHQIHSYLANTKVTYFSVFLVESITYYLENMQMSAVSVTENLFKLPSRVYKHCAAKYL